MSGGNRTRWIVYPLLALLVCGALAFRFDRSGAQAPATKARVHLQGTTAERIPISVTLDQHGRMTALQTHIVGVCENGARWKIGWTPDAPRIPFRAGRDGETAVRETQDKAMRRHTKQHVVAWTRARLAPRGTTASGDMRFVSTFSYPSGRHLTCDSGYIHWSAGKGVSSAPARDGRVPSLAVNPSRARRAFIARADRTCYDQIYQFEVAAQRARRRYRGKPNWRRLLFAAQIAAYDREYAVVARLGQPPEAASLYNAWLASVAARNALAHRELGQFGRGHAWDASATMARIAFLEVRGDAAGQEFGLRVCTAHVAPAAPATRDRPRVSAY